MVLFNHLKTVIEALNQKSENFSQKMERKLTDPNMDQFKSQYNSFQAGIFTNIEYLIVHASPKKPSTNKSTSKDVLKRITKVKEVNEQQLLDEARLRYKNAVKSRSKHS